MKILYVITKSNWGGAQRYVYDLATAFSARGDDVAVALGGDGPLRDKLRAAGIRTVPIPGLERDVRAGDILLPFRLFKLYRREQPDIIHLNSSKIGAAGAFAARLYNLLPTTDNRPQAKIIFTAHGWAFTEPRPLIQKIFFAMVQWKTVLLCHKTIAVSEAVKRQMARFPFTERKMVVILNGVAPPQFKERGSARTILAEHHKRLGADSEKLWIGTISELTRNKGLRILIDAIAQLPKDLRTTLRVCIIGDGEDREKLQETITEKGLRDTVFLLGYVDNAARYLPAFDIFTLSSLKEGLPYVLIEAAYAGVPVIASDTGGISEIVSDAETGLLTQPGDTMALSHALAELMQQSEKRMQYAHAAQEKARQRFARDRTVDETQTLYTEKDRPE